MFSGVGVGVCDARFYASATAQVPLDRVAARDGSLGRSARHFDGYREVVFEARRLLSVGW